MAVDRSKHREWNDYREQAETLAAALPPLLVESERVANTVAQGVHGRRRIGVGETFWEYRHHRPEDPLSAIDWRQSAKTDHLYVRENEWEAAESVWIWRDFSPSMNYASDFAPCTKQDRATILALALCSLLVRGGERIALIGQFHPPSTGRATLRRIAMALSSGSKPGDSLPPLEPLPRFAQIVWLSDLLSPSKEIEKVVHFYAARGVKGHFLQVFDPAEEDLPFEGRVRFEGVEERSTITVGRAEMWRGDYQRRLASHRDALERIAHRYGWTSSLHRTDRPPEMALLALYAGLTGDTISHLAGTHSRN